MPDWSIDLSPLTIAGGGLVGLAVAFLADHALIGLERAAVLIGRLARAIIFLVAFVVATTCLASLQMTPAGLVAAAVALTCFGASAAYDLRERYVDFGLMLVSLAVVLALGAIDNLAAGSPARPLVWAVVAAAPMAFFWGLGLLIGRIRPGPIDPDTGKPGPILGIADVVPWAIAGAAFGPRVALAGLFFGVCVGGLWAVASIAANLIRRRPALGQPMPMVPGFAIGLVLAIILAPA